MPFTIVLISLISTMVNGTLLNFGKRYDNNLRVIFDQWLKFGRAEQSKDLERYLLFSLFVVKPSAYAYIYWKPELCKQICL